MSLRSHSVVVFLVMLLNTSAPARPMFFPGRTWTESTPEAQGVDGAGLGEAVAFLQANAGRDGVSELVIVRNGVIIHKGDNIDKVHGVWSMTKSFTSTVLGLLVDDAKVTVDTHAKDFVPAMAQDFSEVTLKHFATMTSGYRAVGDEPQGSYTHGPSRTPFQPGEPLFAPGTKYAYWDSAMNQFANLLTRIAGEKLEDLFKRRIADPIGMDRSQWRWGDFGAVDGLVVNGGSGNSNRHIFISARQMARFGHLYLNRGMWDGKQLLSADWVDYATRVHVPAATPLGHRESGIDGRGVYGFNWWVNGVGPNGKRLWPAAPPRTYAASGHNNNKMIVIPEWRMVIVRLGLDQADCVMGNDVWNAFIQKIAASVTDAAKPPRVPERNP